MSVSSYVIGDVHGCARQLDDLIGQIRSDLQNNDRIIFLGDLIDGGPDSKGAVEQVVQLRAELGADRVPVIQGNHEEWLLASHADFHRSSWLFSMNGLSTVQSYSDDAAFNLRTSVRSRMTARITISGKRMDRELPYQPFFDAMPPEHLDLLTQGLVDYVEDENVIAVHSKCDPAVSLAEQDPKDLRWGNPEELLATWKGPKQVVVGHTPTWKIDPDKRGHPILTEAVACIDTSPDTTGILTCVRFPDQKVYQAGG